VKKPQSSYGMGSILNDGYRNCAAWQIFGIVSALISLSTILGLRQQHLKCYAQAIRWVHQ